MPEPVVVVDYDPEWVVAFARLKSLLSPYLVSLHATMEHVGSTSIPGAAAKPIIDIDVVVQSEPDVKEAILLLARAGFKHQGDLGIRGREAFESPAGLPANHLYVVVAGSPEHVRHVRFRDYMRGHPEAVREYSSLKKSLAGKFRDDREAYTESKTSFVEGILGLAEGQLG